METQAKQAERILLLAIKYEQAGHFSQALTHYRDAGEKLISLIKTESNPIMKKQLQSKAEEALSRGAFVKKKVEEKNRELKKLGKSEEKGPATPSEISINYESAELYRRIADKYYADVTRKDGTPRKDLLQTVISAHIVEIEIKKTLLGKLGDKLAIAKKQKELMDLVKLLEGFKEIIKQKPEFDERRWLLSHPMEEVKIMTESCGIFGQTFPIWYPSLGVFNIFEPYMFSDPDGLLTLSSKQGKKFTKWLRAHQLFAYDKRMMRPQYVADGISGYEVMQNAVGDCSVVSSIAIAAHYEFKFNYFVIY